jgi:uncharacterized protein (TIGR03435 family)
MSILAVTQIGSFDVATLKLRKGPITLSQDPVVRGRTVTAVAVTLRDLLTWAYSVRYEQLSGGPSWTTDDHYDLIAKSEGDGELTLVQARLMMQSLLADRFQLQTHRETQDVPMYALVQARNGPKLKSISPDSTAGCRVSTSAKGLRMECTVGSLEQLARQLTTSADRIVLDRTGLSGTYAFTLEWWPAKRTPPTDSDVPSIFDAVQEQLGLKLEPIRGPIEKLVIDRVEKPTEN